MTNAFWYLFICGSMIACSPAKPPIPLDEQKIRQNLLEQIVTTSDSKKWNELLLIHGSIEVAEIPYLEKQAHSANQDIRLRATTLLTLVRPHEHVEKQKILQKLAKNPPDLFVFTRALGFFLEKPHLEEGKQLASAQRMWVQKALISTDPFVLAIGIKAGHLLNLPEVNQAMSKALHESNQKSRDSVFEILKQQGAGPFELELKQMLLHPSENDIDLTDIYCILSQSDDASMSEVFKKALSQQNEKQELGFLNGILLSKSRKPWLQSLLLDLMRNSKRLNWNAFGRLTEWGPEIHPQLVHFCLEQYQKAPEIGHPDRRRYLIDLEGCREFLAKLAHRDKFGISEKDTKEAITYLTTWHP